MVSESPRTPAAAQPPLRTRVKWENLLILLVVASFAVIGVIALVVAKPEAGHADAPKLATNDPDSSAAESPDTQITLDDAIDLVTEARSLMREARWDEASDRLATVPSDLRGDSGAGALALTLASTRGTWDQLRSELEAAIKDHRWTIADQALDRLAGIATLDDELAAARRVVDASLAAPKAVRHAVPHRTTTKATATATNPSKPSSGARPQVVSGGGATTPTATTGAQHPKPSSTTASTVANAPAAAVAAAAAQITDQADGALPDEIEDALADIMNGAQLDDLDLGDADQAELESLLGGALAA